MGTWAKLADLQRRAINEEVEKLVKKGESGTWSELVAKVTDSEVPEPWPILAPVFAGDSEIGRDFNGSTLYTERIAYLNENGVTDRALRKFYLRMLSACNDIRNEIAKEERDK